MMVLIENMRTQKRKVGWQDVSRHWNISQGLA